MRRMTFVSAVFLCMTGISGAAPDTGMLAFERGDYVAAYRIWKPAAEQGDAELQFKLGTMSEWGLGIEPDYREAVKWYHRAAEQGHAEAQFTLGFMYGSGQGVRQDDVHAYAWYELAAERGHESAKEFRDATARRLNRTQFMAAQRLTRALDDRITAHCAGARAGGIESKSASGRRKLRC